MCRYNVYTYFIFKYCCNYLLNLSDVCSELLIKRIFTENHIQKI